ncbi:hypothetical protein KY290_021866 [Solanum tuberosum]|uniref:Uncharacterized protein n=1 Tax=Solanum tuberosum TaxID=4113 RepID=A0ABQ7V2R7_SOLTU|nr:hypothetical protein KY285_022318 [Solanum tuberosum]KAH0758373.1 hypothetical protein KY290_021866 [Solanum tuberosum]
MDKETSRTWCWFIELLKGSLDLKDGAKITFISNMQKMLLTKCCLKLNIDGARDLVKYPPKACCRDYFDTECKNMMIDNNFTESFNAWILEARAKPIIEMLEDIRVHVMRLLGEKKSKKLRTWVTDFSPECMKLYIDFRAIAHDCIPCPHAIKALTHKKVDPITEIHWWYSKEAYMLTYKNKMRPVRGQKFWKVDHSSAMLPHDVVKQLGRPKMKRNREPNEARKRKGEWSRSRKGTQMTCSNCGEPNHNVRGCYKAGTQESTFRPQAATQEFEPYGPNVEDKEDPALRPMVICESELRAEKLKTKVVPTGARKIQFYGDHTGASVLTNLPYSPVKTTWKGKKLSLLDMCRYRQIRKESR